MGKFNFGQGVGVICLSVLAGCAQLKTNSIKSKQLDMPVGQSEVVSKVSPDIPSNNILSFVISAKVGETKIVKDAQEHESDLITAGNFYHAASGKLCRRFAKKTTKSDAIQSICNAQAACRNRSGDWYQVRQIVNLDQPEKDIAKCTHL